MFAIYETATGRLHSLSSVMPTSLPAQYTAKDFPTLSNADGKIWNIATLDFDNAPVLKPILTKRDYFARFTDTELDDIFDFANSSATVAQKKRIRSALEYFRIVNEADMNELRVQRFATVLENAGIIAAGRAAQVNG